jgi:hypothetical protein
MQKSFEQLSASLLYCNKCGQAMPVRERLLLVLPDGDLYDYSCQRCGGSVGSKTVKSEPELPQALPRIVPGT